jgi:MFS family permease
VPTALSSGRSPEPLRETRLDLRRLIRASPIAVVACFVVGLANGAFGTLVPVYARGIGLPLEAVALLVAGAVVGGAVMQVPLGRLSDRLDRRWALCGTALAGAAVAAYLFATARTDAPTVILLVTLLGGAMHTIYPVAVAHANDMASEGDFVAVSSGLLLVFGGGAVVGPAVAAAMMQQGGPRWLFLFLVLVYVPLAAHAAWRTRIRPSVFADRQPFVGMETTPATTPETMALDPRAEAPAGQPPARP